MAHSLTKDQLHDIETTERVASCFSLAGTTFILCTFIYSSAFRKPVNRLIFYACKSSQNIDFLSFVRSVDYEKWRKSSGFPGHVSTLKIAFQNDTADFKIIVQHGETLSAI